MKVYTLDGKKFTDKDAFYRNIESIFALPEYFSRNLDGLWDSLSEKNEIEIKIANSRYLVKNLGDYGLKILDLFGDLDDEEGIKVKIKW